LNDVQLSSRIGLVRTTVTITRQRLERQGYVSSHFIPDFKVIGCELLTTLYGEFAGAANQSIEKFRTALLDGVSSAFYMIRFGGHHLSFGAATSLTHVRESIVEHHRLHHESGYLTDKRHNYVFFPLKLTHVPRFFDYAPLLERHFGIKHIQDSQENHGALGDCWAFTKREMKTLVALIEHPNGTDGVVAGSAQVSRQTVNILRNKFINQGVIRRVRIPDVSKLGYGLLAFTHLNMRPDIASTIRRKHAETILDDPAHVVKISGDLESVMLSVYRDYGDYQKSQDSLVGSYRRSGLLFDEPKVKLFPIGETDLVLHHDYANVIPQAHDLIEQCIH
jgi:DNA-binding MarR family transcriptional regulator